MIRHVVSVSGGKDSDVTLKIALARCRRESVIAIFCDTCNEDQAVYDHLDYLEDFHGIKIVRLKADFTDEFPRKRMFIARDVRTRREYDLAPAFDATGAPIPKRDATGSIVTRKVKRAGVELDEPIQKLQKVGGGRRVRWSNKAKRRALAALHPTGNAFLDLCMLKGRFPSRKAQFCTEELKRNIAVEFQLGLMDAGYRVISWQGVRRDESDARKNAKKMERVGRRLWIFRPIVEWTAARVFEQIAACGARPNRLYYEGCDRVGCMPCINSKKHEIRSTAARRPHHIARIAEWELKVSACSKRGFSTFFHKVDDVAHEAPITVFSRSKIEKVIEWAKTTRGGRQFDLLAGVDDANGCSSSYGLCDQEGA